MEKINGISILILLMLPIVLANNCIDGICYECDGDVVERDGKMVCLNCNEGFELVNGNCEVKPKPLEPSFIDKTLYRFFPNNPFLGFLITISFAIIVFYLFRNWESIKRKMKSANQ